MNAPATADRAAALPALAVSCPRCGAQPGKRCTSHNGTRERRNDVHQQRTTAYKEREDRNR